MMGRWRNDKKTFRRWIAVFGALCFCGGIAFYFFVFSAEPGVTDTENLPAATIEAAAHLRLPNSARNVHTHLVDWLDYDIHVRFEMDASDLAAFWASTACAKEPAGSSLPGQMRRADKPWWRPEETKSQEVREHQEADKFTQYIAVDRISEGRVLVHVYVSGD